MIFFVRKLLTCVFLAQVNDSIGLGRRPRISKDCGVVKLKGRITGGQEAFLGQFPWMARIAHRTNNKKVNFNCGGVLLNSRYVLTAAHCLHIKEASGYMIRLGENFADTDDDCENGICAPPVQDRDAEKITVHPKYISETAKNDIAVIRLKRPIVFNDFVSSICLPLPEMTNKSYISQSVEVAGWGVMDSSSERVSPVLLLVRLPVRNSSACNDFLASKNKLGPYQLCAGAKTGEDFCSGDSGGPMMKIEYDYDGIKKYFVLGLASFGKSYCGESPSVFTNVMPYVNWILGNVQADQVCKPTRKSA